MSKLIYQGNIVSVDEKKGQNNEIFYTVGISLMPHCTICRIDTYKCPHIQGSKCTMYFSMEERPNGNFLKYFDNDKIEVS